MYELAFAVFGFLLGLVPPWFARKRRLKTHWCALRAEMYQCKENATTLLEDKVQSPLYRLPLIAYQTSYPVLLADGAAAENEASVLGKFFATVQDINRGLDNAAAIHMSGNVMDNKLTGEYNRNKLKAKNLLDKVNGNPSLFEQAKEIVDQKIALKWWQYGKYA
jgi:hypothetical protein